MTRAVLAGVVILLAAPPAAIAHFEPRAARDHLSRFVAGVNLAGGVFGDRAATTTSGGDPSTNTIVRFGALIGGEHRVADRWWLGGSVGWSGWLRGAGIDVGYGYTLLDLTVAPRLDLLRWSLPVQTTTLDLALPIGLSKPFVEVPQRRAFAEQVESSWGWHAGAMLGVTVLFHSHRPTAVAGGVRLGGGYLRHASHRRTTFTPVDPAGAAIVEETDVVDQEVLLTLAGVVAF